MVEGTEKTEAQLGEAQPAKEAKLAKVQRPPGTATSLTVAQIYRGEVGRRDWGGGRLGDVIGKPAACLGRLGGAIRKAWRHLRSGS
jgi:hypothetical protein